jgi:hypothetical protein
LGRRVRVERKARLEVQWREAKGKEFMCELEIT